MTNAVAKPPPVLYWFSGASEIPDEWAWRFERPMIARNSIGPAEGTGLLASPFCGTPKVQYAALRYSPNLQNWVRTDDGVWTGTFNVCGPADIARPTFLPGGYDVELGDGNVWRVPVANPLLPTCSLQQTEYFAWDEKEKKCRWQKRVAEDWRQLSEQVEKYADIIMSAVATDSDDVDIDDDELRDICARILCLNYDVIPSEISVFNCLDSESWGKIFHAFVDVQNLLQLSEGMRAVPLPDADAPEGSRVGNISDDLIPAPPESAPTAGIDNSLSLTYGSSLISNFRDVLKWRKRKVG
tara:strand:- start:380 stop:1273 length:894 start_codon:yes stop_codon:yes gene_type:complete